MFPFFNSIRQICIAGTKDRRAITSQLATAYRVESEKLAKLNEILIGIRLGNFKYASKELHLGALNGNRFTIVLRFLSTNFFLSDLHFNWHLAFRNVDASPALVEENVVHLKEKGFINYYGTQRFGTTSVPTHAIGKYDPSRPFFLLSNDITNNFPFEGQLYKKGGRMQLICCSAKEIKHMVSIFYRALPSEISLT